jgi:hypothetical protein
LIEKPAHMFDCGFQWGHLARFAARVGGPAQMGVVSGRRRQGKTFPLEALARQAGGLYFGATEATETESRALLCRDHAALAPPDLFGELPGEVGAGVVSDPERGTQIQIDVLASTRLSPPPPTAPRPSPSTSSMRYPLPLQERDAGAPP